MGLKVVNKLSGLFAENKDFFEFCTRNEKCLNTKRKVVYLVTVVQSFQKPAGFFWFVS